MPACTLADLMMPGLQYNSQSLSGVADCRRWAGISVEGSTNPFPAPFYDWTCTVKLLPVSMTAQTFMDWTADFNTVPEVLVDTADAMHDQRFCACLSAQRQLSMCSGC